MRYRYWIVNIIIGCISLFFIFTPHSASAAVLKFLPHSDGTNIGDEIHVHVAIDSDQTSINAAQGVIQFSKDTLEVKNINKTISVFNLWLDEPAFSNTDGLIHFAGGSGNGVSGRSLHLFQITFLIKAAGPATITFTDGAITTSDGLGSNVLTNMEGLTFLVSSSQSTAPYLPPSPPSSSPTTTIPALPTSSLGSPTTEATSTAQTILELVKPEQITRIPTPARMVPENPFVRVPLYPDQTAWYNAESLFTVYWELPSDILAVATALNSDPVFIPNKPEGLFDNKMFPAPKKGVSYIHVRFKNNLGWGDTTHYRIAVDTIPPAPFIITHLTSAITDNPRPVISYTTTDPITNLRSYQIKIDNQLIETTTATTYTFPPLSPGYHTIQVFAEDEAGNNTAAMSEITILPISPPTLRIYNTEISEGDLALHGSGEAAAGGRVTIAILSESGKKIAEDTVTVTDKGQWIWSLEKSLPKGQYTITAIVTDTRGARSLEVVSDPITIHSRFRHYYLPTAIVTSLLVAGVSTGSFIIGKRNRKTVKKKTKKVN